LKKELVARLPDVRFNGDQEDCLPGLLHFSIPGVDGPALLKMLDGEGIAVSGGAACTTGETKPSYVLLALGLAEEYTRCPVRVTLGRGTTVAAVERFVAVLDGAVRQLRGEKQGG